MFDLAEIMHSIPERKGVTALDEVNEGDLFIQVLSAEHVRVWLCLSDEIAPELHVFSGPYHSMRCLWTSYSPDFLQDKVKDVLRKQMDVGPWFTFAE